jgi:hypothetical protein
MESHGFGIFKPMTPLRLVYILSFATLLLWSSGCQSPEGDVLPFIKKVTEIGFPDQIKILSEYDNGEYEAMGKYELRPEDIPSFIASHPFVPVPLEYPRPPLMDFNSFCQADLIPLSDTIPLPDIRQLHYFSGCKPCNSWVFIMDEKTGELWINLQYPDPGGLTRGCNL